MICSAASECELCALADSIQRLVVLLRQLPGIGEKTATRLVHAILAADPEYAKSMAFALEELVENVHPCPLCGNLTEDERCRICSDPQRQQALICVVEKVQDLMAIDASGEYHGLYHVLGGVLNPLENAGPDELRIESLMERLTDGVKELIIATSSSVEGEATALYLKKRIEHKGIVVSRLAAGIPVGGELEYVDRSTIGLAIRGRREIG